MKINGNTQIVGDKVILVPYKKCHVERYHRWMESPQLQELTASEPLSLEEEYQMQQSWFVDDDKCTFIVLDRRLFDQTESEVQSMIGDTNLYINHDETVIAEGEIMIAEPDFLGQRRGWEAMLLMFRYGIESLSITKYQVKIGMANVPSLGMFKKMNFKVASESEVFQEVTLEAEVDSPWKSWLIENTEQFKMLPHANEDLI